MKYTIFPYLLISSQWPGACQCATHKVSMLSSNLKSLDAGRCEPGWSGPCFSGNHPIGCCAGRQALEMHHSLLISSLRHLVRSTLYYYYYSTVSSTFRVADHLAPSPTLNCHAVRLPTHTYVSIVSNVAFPEPSNDSENCISYKRRSQQFGFLDFTFHAQPPARITVRKPSSITCPWTRPH